jgi:hypothetical protein
MSTKQEVEALRRQLADAETKLRQEQQSRRRDVVEQLGEIKKQMNAMEFKARELAESAGLVFYYSSGYEEWSWMNASEWSESSKHC